MCKFMTVHPNVLHMQVFYQVLNNRGDSNIGDSNIEGSNRGDSSGTETAGQQIQRSILHLRPGLYQNTSLARVVYYPVQPAP